MREDTLNALLEHAERLEEESRAKCHTQNKIIDLEKEHAYSVCRVSGHKLITPPTKKFLRFAMWCPRCTDKLKLTKYTAQDVHGHGDWGYTWFRVYRCESCLYEWGEITNYRNYGR